MGSSDFSSRFRVVCILGECGASATPSSLLSIPFAILQSEWQRPSLLVWRALCTQRRRHLASPDDQMDLQEIGKKGLITVHLQSWSNMLMRGSREHPMHTHPFTLVRVERRNAEGQRIGKVMWLIVMGELRDQIELHEAYLGTCQKIKYPSILRRQQII